MYSEKKRRNRYGQQITYLFPLKCTMVNITNEKTDIIIITKNNISSFSHSHYIYNISTNGDITPLFL